MQCTHLLATAGAGVLGDSLGTLADSVLGQLSGQKQTHCGLDFPAGDGRAAVVVSQAAGLCGDALEDVVDERVHDRHSLAADTSVGVHLLQHLVDVDGVGFLSPAASLLLIAWGACLGGGLLGSLRRDFGWHDSDEFDVQSFKR